MLRRRFYYLIKPYVPWRVRMSIRRLFALRKRRLNSATWPIQESAGEKPASWPGWPEGKKFAVVLTHDVEGPGGVAKCLQLAELEMEQGFRSSFNFIPEGDYRVTAELRDWLKANGFEVGVHDLNHDGKLFESREGFERKAKRINHYLREWGAVGYRSGFMLRNLHWIHEIEMEYDASTFDTDPFEPQPDGLGTIFPSWIPLPGSRASSASNGASPGRSSPPFSTKYRRHGYAELPYTLAQDSTLYLLLGEKTNDVWKRKLAWLVQRGGMALVNVHPDYLSFNTQDRTAQTFPAELYRDFLRHIRENHAGEYWHALPRAVGAMVNADPEKFLVQDHEARTSPAKEQPLIWIDLDNTPHVPFFKPIIRELKQRGYRVHVTGRDAFQVRELAAKMGVECKIIGHHYGKNPFMKVIGLLIRTVQLLPIVLKLRPVVGLSHGSRSQVMLCNFFRIPTILVMDYEFSNAPPFSKPLWEIVPDSLPDSGLHTHHNDTIRKYRGIKEDVYVPDFKPDPGILDRLNLRGASLVVTARPPANEAHYHNPESEILFDRFMNIAVKHPGVRIVLLPRNKRQEEQLRTKSPEWFSGPQVTVPVNAEDGVNLLWHSDLVVSGGGTMNREAAALGVPVYSIFRGKIGAVDHRLQEEGRLTLVTSVDEVASKIKLVRRDHDGAVDSKPREALRDIVSHVENIISRYVKA